MKVPIFETTVKTIAREELMKAQLAGKRLSGCCGNL
jgi:hypothetical protein